MFSTGLIFLTQREQTVALITKNQLPAIYSERFAIAHGGLAFYGVDRIELYRAAASYVDRILRGEKAGDLPYQQPTKYELVINRKAAAALGLESRRGCCSPPTR